MYGGPPNGPQPGYSYPPGSAAQAAMGTTAGGGYGPVYYNIPQTGYAGLALTEQRKRQHDTLDAFFGDVKRRNIDPSQYYDLGTQFGGMSSLPMFSDGGYHGNGGGGNYGNSYHAGPNQHFGGDGAGGGGTATSTMAMPQPPNFDTFNNLKTKNDLMSIDHFLEQLQKTVYEQSNRIVPGRPANEGMVHQGIAVGNIDPAFDRARNSPPGSSFSATDSSTTGPSYSTPGSHLSSHSPASAHSHPSQTGSSGYPTLPSVAAMSQNQQMGNFMPQQSSGGVPPNGLGNQYEDFERGRRYSGGYMQRMKPASPHSQHSDGSRGSTEGKDIKPASPGKHESNEGENAQDERLEGWVQNMRTIEALRKYLNNRIQHGEFEAEGSPSGSADAKMEDGQATPKASSPAKDYPMEDAKSVAYPTLRSAA